MNAFGNGGGGFIPNNSPGQGSQNSPRGGGTRHQNKSFVSLTVAQVLKANKMSDADSAEFWLDGRELQSVSIVGVIRKMNKGQTKSAYEVDDGTAGEWIEVTQWNDNSDNEAQTNAEFEVGKTVRVFGRIQQYQQPRRINCYRMVLVEDTNVVTFHMLECIAHHLHAKKVPGVAGAGSLSANATMPAGSAYGAQPQDNADSMPRDKQQVLTAVESGAQNEEGASVTEIVARLAGTMDEAKVRDAIDWLSDEGHIYSTVDDDHFRSVADE